MTLIRRAHTSVRTEARAELGLARLPQLQLFPGSHQLFPHPQTNPNRYNRQGTQISRATRAHSRGRVHLSFESTLSQDASGKGSDSPLLDILD